MTEIFRRLEMAGHVVMVGNTSSIKRRGWQDNIKVDLLSRGWKVDKPGLGSCPVAGCGIINMAPSCSATAMLLLERRKCTRVYPKVSGLRR
jgi:hypothetical protein